MLEETYIEGLKAELEQHIAAGRTDVAKQVRAELARLGVKPDKAERAVDKAPRETR